MRYELREKIARALIRSRQRRLAGVSMDAALDDADAVLAVLTDEGLLDEYEQVDAEIVEWIGRMGYPYDFTTEHPIPERYMRPLAEWWWRDSGGDLTVDDWLWSMAGEDGAFAAYVKREAPQPAPEPTDGLRLFNRPAPELVDTEPERCPTCDEMTIGRARDAYGQPTDDDCPDAWHAKENPR